MRALVITAHKSHFVSMFDMYYCIQLLTQGMLACVRACVHVSCVIYSVYMPCVKVCVWCVCDHHSLLCCVCRCMTVSLTLLLLLLVCIIVHVLYLL
jgi:hypothetical protein